MLLGSPTHILLQRIWCINTSLGYGREIEKGGGRGEGGRKRGRQGGRRGILCVQTRSVPTCTCIFISLPSLSPTLSLQKLWWKYPPRWCDDHTICSVWAHCTNTKIREILTLAICVACWICMGVGRAVQRVGGAITFKGTRYWQNKHYILLFFLNISCR